MTSSPNEASSLDALGLIPEARSGAPLRRIADSALKASAGFWFLVALLGQWMFAYYVAAFYGGAASRGDLQAWNKVFPRGYAPGHTFGNLAVAAHLSLALIIHVGGPLQLVPWLRNRARAFHRWVGRLYLPAVALTSLVGLYMTWVRGSVGDRAQHAGITVDALLILGFAFMALRTALSRDFGAHRRWALRLFMVSSAVWFFRVGFSLWIVINRGPAGFDPETFSGPFLTFISFADSLVPLAFLELYLRVKDRAGAAGQAAMAAALFVLTLAMSVGILAAAKIMWLPRL